MKYLKRVKVLLTVGLVASVLTIALGEMPIGYTKYQSTTIEGYLAGFAGVSDLRLCLGVLFGSVGIALQHYGFKAIAEIISRSGEEKSASIVRNGAMALAMFGGLVHALSVAVMYVARFGIEQVYSFITYLLVPIVGLFAAFYLPMLVVIAFVIIRGKTLFPKWAAIFNPLIVMLVLNGLSLIGINTPLFNALWMANIGLGSLWTFGGLLGLLNKYIN